MRSFVQATSANDVLSDNRQRNVVATDNLRRDDLTRLRLITRHPLETSAGYLAATTRFMPAFQGKAGILERTGSKISAPHCRHSMWPSRSLGSARRG